MRVAILTHSTNPRGGVAHALALAEALCAMGHEAVVHAPDPTGRGFYRDAACPTVGVAARTVSGSTLDLVRARITDYLAHFASQASCDFDVFHAHCGIGGNALATLKHRRLIPGHVRTVHHLDAFADPGLARLSERAILEASHRLAVSRATRDDVARAFGGPPACVVGNGVDVTIFHPRPEPGDADLRARLGLGDGPVWLAVGGLEERKNALATIEAFALARRRHPDARLVIAGGASLLDHSGYRARCRAALDRLGLATGPGGAVVETGPLPQAAMPALYRAADALVFPSLREGFGLCVLEAMACGTPTVVARVPPFTEYLGERDTLFVDPRDPAGIARAMAAALEPARRAGLRAAGFALARAHTWRACAERHLDAYAACARRAPEPALAVP